METAARKQQIALAVQDIIAEEGFEKLSIPEVARRVEMGQSSLYRHFKSKDDMVIAALDVLQDKFLEIFNQLKSQNIEPLEMMRFSLDMSKQLMMRTIIIPRVIFGLPKEGHTGVRKRVRLLLDTMLALLSGIIKEGQAKGQIRKNLDPDHTALEFWGLFVSTKIRWYICDGVFNIDEYHNHVWEMFVRAIEPRQGDNKGEEMS